MHVHNNCDIAGICPNSEQLAINFEPVGVEVEDTIINFAGHQVSQCMRSCGTNPNGDTAPLSVESAGLEPGTGLPSPLAA